MESSLTRASITRVPTINLTSAEEIAPRCREFTGTKFPSINLTSAEEIAPRCRELTGTKFPMDAKADAQAPSKVKQRVNFFQNFLSRRKRTEGNMNNNGFSLSDVASAVESAAKSKSKSSKKKSISVSIKGCCC